MMLPARGPRPTMKGEEPVQLRLMDDIVVPRAMSAESYHPDRPPYASQSMRPTTFSPVRPPNPVQPTTAADKPPMNAIQAANTQPQTVAAQPARVTNAALVNAAVAANAPDPKMDPDPRLTILVLTSNQVLEVTRYRIDGGLVNYRTLNGSESSVEEAQIDWRATTEMTSQLRSVDLPILARQTN